MHPETFHKWSMYYADHFSQISMDGCVYKNLYIRRTPLWKSNRNFFSESNLIKIIRYQYIVFDMY